MQGVDRGTNAQFHGRALLTGVKPGEKIVVQGIHKLGDGMRVRVVPASEFN